MLMSVFKWNRRLRAERILVVLSQVMPPNQNQSLTRHRWPCRSRGHPHVERPSSFIASSSKLCRVLLIELAAAQDINSLGYYRTCTFDTCHRTQFELMPNPRPSCCTANDQPNIRQTRAPNKKHHEQFRHPDRYLSFISSYHYLSALSQR